MDFLMQLNHGTVVAKSVKGIAEWIVRKFFKLRLLYVVTDVQHYLHLFGFKSMSRYLLGDVVFFNLPTMFCSQLTKALSIKENSLLEVSPDSIWLT